jgi:phospholipase/carboxylesterase
MSADPHGGQPTIERGASLEEARAALILFHGRGAPAASMAPLADALLEGGDAPVAVRLPQAAGGVWYPQRFVAPREANQPWLDSALARLTGLIDEAEAAGVPPERIVLGGFSQGACLALEAFARRGRRLAGVIAYAGGLIGATLDEADYPGGLDGTPVFLGSADPDPHIPTGRVEASAGLLRAKGATVDARLYPGLGHALNDDELEAGRELLKGALDGTS